MPTMKKPTDHTQKWIVIDRTTGKMLAGLYEETAQERWRGQPRWGEHGQIWEAAKFDDLDEARDFMKPFAHFDLEYKPVIAMWSYDGSRMPR